MYQPILDAARACYLRLGVQKTTMADIAAQAGISRATLYRRFPKHEDVFLSVLEIESEELAKDAAAHLARLRDPAERVVEGILFCIQEVPNRPLHQHFFSGETALWSARHVLRSDALQRMARNLLGVSLGRNGSDQRATRALEDLAEWILRILISFITHPSPDTPHDPEAPRRLLHRMLAPTIEAAVIRIGEHP